MARDSLNPQGMRIEWEDTGVRICREVIQPIRIFFVALPNGTQPSFRTMFVRSHAQNSGLPATPNHVLLEQDNPSNIWAEFKGVETWRGYRLARIEVNVRIGSKSASEILDEITLAVVFTGELGREASVGREARILPTLAINGSIAGTWWEEPARVSRLDETTAWPTFDLVRIGITETGLYQISGSWVGSGNLIGQPSNGIRLFGNGGRLLPNNTAEAVDSMLRENAILVQDGGDGRFDREDRILFLGKGLKGADYCDGTYLAGTAHHSPFSTENTYFVGYDPSGTTGLRMTEISVAGSPTDISTTSARSYLDQDVIIYSGASVAESGLNWYMTGISGGQERSFVLEVAGGIGAAGQLIVDARRTEGGFQMPFTVSLGGTVVANTSFSNSPFTINVPQGLLTSGNVLVSLRNNSSDPILLNYIDMKYVRSLAAPSGYLEFFAPADLSGLFRYSVADLDVTSYILDISSSLEPRYKTGNTIVDSSSAASTKRYIGIRSDRIGTPTYRGAVARQNLDYTQLRDPANSAGMILLTFDEGYEALRVLKEFHESYRVDPHKTIRVRLTDVWDEFGWGVHDVTAIRNFLKYAYEHWRGPSGNDAPVKYVLLVGDGDYDYRNIESAADANWMPPWESGGTCRDDFFAIFPGSQIPQLMIGRWPVQSVNELESIISKTIAYASTPLYGPWKNTATFAADDEWKGGGCGEYYHTTQAETLINDVLPPYFTFKKIYEILYPFRITSLGSAKPDATRDLLETINRGTLFINYTGHGNERIWTDEQLFLMDRDRNLLDNNRMWPMFLAATCSWGGFDRPIIRCFPEILLADPSDGAVTCVAATRFTSVGSNLTFSQTFYRALFLPGVSARRSFGEAMLTAKTLAGQSANEYHIFGDPVIRLATPEYFARVTSRDDSLRALSLFHLSGEIAKTDTGQIWSDFQGVVEARVFDTEDSAAYYWCGNTSSTPYYYRLPGNAIFRGKATVRDGRFDVVFRVPRDVRYGGTRAKINLYFYGKSDSEADSADGINIRQDTTLAIAGSASVEQDSVPPAIGAWLEVSSFRSGDVVTASPRLHVDLADSSGINLSGEVGHKITVRIDDADPQDLTPYFDYNVDSHTRGSLEKIVGPLSEGEHRLVIEAWDSFNNLNRYSVVFSVGKSGEAGYAIRDLYNWPNPVKDITYFTYYLTQDGTRRVSLKLFTLTGKLVYEMDGLGTRGPAFNSNAERPWDGRDRDGHLLGNGVYFYRVRAEHADGHSTEATGKLVILR